jgi:tetratricopeptide (TPR) repeat protein
MPSKLPIIIFFCLVINVGFAQQAYIDSLQKKLATSAQDTNRVKLLAKLADIYTNYDSAILYARQGVALAEKINFPEWEAACFLSMGNVYAAILDEINAIESYQKSLEIYERLDNKNGIYLATGAPARIFYLEKDFRRELPVHFKLAELAKKFNSKKYLANAFANIGNTYYNLGQLDSAEIYMRKGIVLSNEMNPSVFAYSVGALGDILTEKGKFNEALVYLHQSL